MLDLTLVSEARHGLLFKVIPTVNDDHGEMAAHFHIVANKNSMILSLSMLRPNMHLSMNRWAL